MKRRYIKKELLLLFCMHGMCLVAGGTFTKKWGEKAFQAASKAASEVKTAAGKVGSATKKAAGSVKTAAGKAGLAAKKAAGSVKTAAESGYSSAASSAKKAFGKFKRPKAAEAEMTEVTTQPKSSVPLKELEVKTLPKTSLKTRLKESAGNIKESIVAAPGKLKTGLQDAASSARQKLDDMLFARRAKKAQKDLEEAKKQLVKANQDFAKAQVRAGKYKMKVE